MKRKIILLFLCSFFIKACGQKSEAKKGVDVQTETRRDSSTIAPNGNTIATRFTLPKGYVRKVYDTTLFATYLRNLPLKEANAKVKHFDGSTKPNNNIYAAVVDLPIGKRDLHQCADAVMRLRAEYLFGQKKYDSIHFNFTNGFKANYANWRIGKRIVVKGNDVLWKQSTQASDDPKDFWKYLEMVFSYAGTASLEKEMKSISIEEMQIGDVFIQGGFPGHAVIVVDMAMNESTNEKIFLLAQSYMPAQEIQVLQNPNNIGLSPWYAASEIADELRTPEWKFKSTALKRFSN